MKSGFYRLFNLLSGLLASVLMLFVSGCCNTVNREDSDSKIFAAKPEITSMGTEEKWTRCFMSSDGSIYFRNFVSHDSGKTLSELPDTGFRDVNGAPERAVFVKDDLFYALDGPTSCIKPGVYKGKAWRSADRMKTISIEEPLFFIPGGCRPQPNIENWYGIFVYRTILEISPDRWLMTMYGNMETDTLIPCNRDAKKELEYMMRTIIVTSDDHGRTWNYLSSVAIPKEGDPVGEGFVEPAITKLDDGRLLCVMRSGHHFPLYSSWSSDTGKTWTPPLYTGFDRGCDPCLITLHDGRVALSWGKRFPEGWSKISTEGDKGSFEYPGAGYTSLSISNDGGQSWETDKVIRNSGTCYSTIFEIEPGNVFMQCDQWYCKIRLKKKY